VTPSGGGFVEVPSGGAPTRSIKVPGSSEAYLAVARFVKREEPARQFVRFVVQADSADGERSWYVGASATGPMDHPLLARDGGLVRLLEKCVRSFSLEERAVARLPVAKAPRAKPQFRPATIDAVAVRATGAPSEREAFRVALEAMATGDAAAWSRVVVYGYGEAFTKAFDDSRLASARLARALRQKPIPGIGSYVSLQEAIGRSRQVEELLENVESLPLPPREGEKVDGGATGGPMRLVERGGRFFIERFVVDDDPDSGPSDRGSDRGRIDPTVRGFLESWRASATAHDEAAALHLAGQFRDVAALEQYIERREKELMPEEPEGDE
jgi:hypothetical protein